MNLPIKKQKGFTLMEILVYLAVLAILISAVSTFLIWATKSNTKAKVMREVSDNGYRAMEIITHEIKEAESIYTPTSSLTQLSLESMHYLPQGEKTSYLDFYLCEATTLCLKKELENPIALTPENIEVNNLQFIQIATSSVQIELGLNFKNPQNRPEYQASIDLISTVSLRTLY